jgi:hypothetical protein
MYQLMMKGTDERDQRSRKARPSCGKGLLLHVVAVTCYIVYVSVTLTLRTTNPDMSIDESLIQSGTHEFYY